MVNVPVILFVLIAGNIMKLNRLTTFAYFPIKQPIWYGGQTCVGLRENMMQRNNKIDILYVRKKDGLRSFPNALYFNKANLLSSYKRQVVGSGVKLVWIPLSELEPLEIEGLPTKPKVSTPRFLNEAGVKELHPNVYEIFFEKRVRLL